MLSDSQCTNVLRQYYRILMKQSDSEDSEKLNDAYIHLEGHIIDFFIAQENSAQSAAFEKNLTFFKKILTGCKSVIATSMKPHHKEYLVTLMNVVDEYESITHVLAIGDGANDALMVNKASVGIQIVNAENESNVDHTGMNADIVVSEFSSLERLLLIHGRQSYRRQTFMILHYFFKGFVFALVSVLLCAESTSMSGVLVVENRNFFEMFTFFPSLMYTLYDIDVQTYFVSTYPIIYYRGIMNMDF